MNTHKVSEIFIGDGTAFDANNTNIAAVANQMDIVGGDMTCLDPAGNDTVVTQPTIYIVNKLANGDIKRSFPIKGTSLAGLSCSRYKPAAREVWGVGYQRGYRTEQNTTGTYTAASGSIEVNNSTLYELAIVFKWDKQFYSERAETLRISFTSAAAATQLSIATQITDAINNSAFGSQPSGIKVIKAVTVGDGTGVYGLTGASNYGVEIWGLDVNQFSNTQYAFRQVRFSVHVNDASGFGTTTTCTETQAFKYGSGTYAQIRTLEKKCMGYEGGNINLRQWPVPELDYSSTSAYILSAAIAETVTGTISEDKVTFSGTIAGKLTAGDKVELGGVNYEIKYFISTTVAVLTSVLTAGLAAAAVKLRMKYDTVNIEFNDAINGPTGVVAVANKSVVIAVPAIDAGGAYNSLSTAGTNLKAILDGWMTTTPRAFANISI